MTHSVSAGWVLFCTYINDFVTLFKPFVQNIVVPSAKPLLSVS